MNRGKIPISATMLRDLMVTNDRKEWMKWVDPRLHKMYDRLRNELMTVAWYQERLKQLLAERSIKERENKTAT